jgi:hypothetical protein
MRSVSLTAASLVLVAAIAAIGQRQTSDSDPVVARLSYKSGEMFVGDYWQYKNRSPHICLAVYQSEYYQISRETEHGNDRTLEGLMSKKDFGELQELLNNINFQSEGGGIQYLQGAESLVVELFRHSETKHYFWVNPEHRNPLPRSAIKIVNWLEEFQARGATPFKHYEASDIPRICPSMNENPLPITTALNIGLGDIICDPR